MLILARVGCWYRAHLAERAAKKAVCGVARDVARRRAALRVGILLCLIFSKYFYLRKPDQLLHPVPDRHVRDRRSADAQLPACSCSSERWRPGTFLGRPVGDRVGVQGGYLGLNPRRVCRSPSSSPYAGLFWTTVLTVPIGLILASAFSAIMVYAQEAVAKPRGDGGWAVLRVRVRNGRRRGRGAGVAGGSDQYRLRVPGLFVPAAHRLA